MVFAAETTPSSSSAHSAQPQPLQKSHRRLGCPGFLCTVFAAASAQRSATPSKRPWSQ